jgi:hypothetical protein
MAGAFIAHLLIISIPAIDELLNFIKAGLLCLVIVWCWYRGAMIIFWIICDKRYGEGEMPINGLEERTNYRINNDQKILVLRGVSDEASLSLGIGSAIGALSRFLSIAVTRVGRFLFFLGLLMLASSYMYGSSDSHFGIEKFAFDMYGWAIWLSLIMLIARVTAGLGRLLFGREMLFMMEGREIDTCPSPDTAGNVRLVTVPPNVFQKGLRHGLYANGDAIKEIGRWLFVNFRGGDYAAALRSKMFLELLAEGQKNQKS